MGDPLPYEVVVGLEVHAQLSTNSKLFCGDAAAFGGEPNTHLSPITLGHPGTLPFLNRKAVDYAVKMGLACASAITRTNFFARKNYFYPDLPKGYQISQHTTPICVGGEVSFSSGDSQRTVRLNRIHLEEDAGKSLHEVSPESTSVDLNRAGVPLIEIVTEPDLRSGEEAAAYLSEIRKRLRYLEICDGNMEEGSLRCDANISIRKKGDPKLGTKVEVKNLNSIRNVKRAIEAEAERLIQLAEAGSPILQQTRSFDASTGTTFALRTKEEANDYRYFTDPDLSPFEIPENLLQKLAAEIPEMPEAKILRYQSQYQLSRYDATVLAEEKETALYFESLLNAANAAVPEQVYAMAKAAANWLMGPLRSYLNENHLQLHQLQLSPIQLIRLIQLVENNQVNFSVASSKLLQELIRQPTTDPLVLAEELNLLQNTDTETLDAWIQEVLTRMPDKVAEYRKGKKGLLGLFVGEVKKLSKGKADPKLTNDLLLQKLNS